MHTLHWFGLIKKISEVVVTRKSLNERTTWSFAGLAGGFHRQLWFYSVILLDCLKKKVANLLIASNFQIKIRFKLERFYINFF